MKLAFSTEPDFGHIVNIRSLSTFFNFWLERTLACLSSNSMNPNVIIGWWALSLSLTLNSFRLVKSNVVNVYPFFRNFSTLFFSCYSSEMFDCMVQILWIPVEFLMFFTFVTISKMSTIFPCRRYFKLFLASSSVPTDDCMCYMNVSMQYNLMALCM